MNVLVLGGNGFIGSHLVDELLIAGHSVRVFDHFSERYRPPLLGVDYRFGQFGDVFSMAEALHSIDLVYHLISTTVPSTSNMNPVDDISDNLIPSVVLLEQMIKMGIKRIVFISSGGTVYGVPQSVPVSEEHPLNPICSYGVIKVAIENYLKMYMELYGLKPTIIRPSNPFGPRQGHDGVQGVISTFLSKALRGEPLNVWGDGSIVRDFLYISDLVKLAVTAGESGYVGVFNAGYGSGVSIRTVIDMISEAVGVSPVINFQPKRSFDIQEVFLDIAKASSTFNWKPTVNLEQGILNHLKWLKTQLFNCKTNYEG